MEKSSHNQALTVDIGSKKRNWKLLEHCKFLVIAFCLIKCIKRFQYIRRNLEHHIRATTMTHQKLLLSYVAMHQKLLLVKGLAMFPFKEHLFEEEQLF